MRLYLDEAGRRPLLTPEEEVSLARAIESGRDASDVLAGGRPVGDDERAELLRRADLGKEARTTFINANLRLVVSIAKAYTNLGVPLPDLVQEGNLGLLKAVERWDWRRGLRFSTYATWWIRQAVTRALYNTSRTIRVPVHAADRARHLRRAADEMAAIVGRAPTVRELAESLGANESDVAQLLTTMRAPLSLSAPIGDDPGRELADTLPAPPDESPLEDAEREAIAEEVEELLRVLPGREALLIRARFGIGDAARSLDELACLLGLSRERVRQVEMTAMWRLRKEAQLRGTKSLLTT